MTVGKVITYISYTDQARGIASVQANYDLIDEVCPSWWAPDISADGSVVLQEDGVTTEDAAFVIEAQAAGLIVRPVIANYYGSGTWDWTPISTIINDAGLRATHTAAIVSLCATKGYDGIDVDYEHGVAADRDAFTTFIQELVAAMHNAGLTVSMALHPKEYLPGGSDKTRAQDWIALGQAADQIRVMLYDYDPDAGEASQSPYTWWERVVPFAASVIPRNKLVVGAPAYGYDWVTATNAWVDYMWLEIEALRVAQSATRILDPIEKSPYFAYPAHEVWYEDAESLSIRAALIRHNGAAGMHFWRAGGEDPDQWASVKAALAGPVGVDLLSLTVNPTKDASLDANDADNNRGSNASLFVKSSTERRVVLTFPTHTIPSGATITAATLRLFKASWLGTDPIGRTYVVDAVTSAWVEGLDSSTGANGGATWSHADYNTTAWTTPGGDYDSGDEVSALVPADGNWMEWDVLDLVANRVDPSIVDLIVRDTVIATNHQAVFTSKEGAGAERPQLIVDFSVPSSGLLVRGVG